MILVDDWINCLKRSIFQYYLRLRLSLLQTLIINCNKVWMKKCIFFFFQFCIIHNSQEIHKMWSILNWIIIVANQMQKKTSIFEWACNLKSGKKIVCATACLKCGNWILLYSFSKWNRSQQILKTIVKLIN